MDKLRSGQPYTRKDKLMEVMAALEEDRRKSVIQVSQEVQMPHSTCQKLLQKDLKLSKVCAKFVLHILTDEQHQHRKRFSENNLDSVRNESRFLETIISGDETWISVFQNQLKLETCEWVQKG